MGWIVRDAVARYRREIGVYHFEDWRACATAIGLHVAVIDMGPTKPALLLNGRLIVNRKLAPKMRARYAWHEIGHHLLHAGDSEFWRGLPGGDSLIRKFERQAWEFAMLYPVWE